MRSLPWSSTPVPAVGPWPAVSNSSSQLAWPSQRQLLEAAGVGDAAAAGGSGGTLTVDSVLQQVTKACAIILMQWGIAAGGCAGVVVL